MAKSNSEKPGGSDHPASGQPAGSPKQGARANTGLIANKLQAFYNSVKEEAIPDRFLDLLEQLDRLDDEPREPSRK